MDFGFSEEQEMLRGTCRKFLEEQVPIERARTLGESGRFDRALWRRIGELGWAGLTVPEENGGLGLGLVDLLVLAEEHGRLCQPGLFLSTAGVATVLADLASEHQRATWLPEIATGERTATWAHYESGGRWGPREVALSAERKDGGWCLSGTKRLVSDGVDADLLLVSARTDSGPALFLVSARAQGVEIVPHRALDLTRTLASITFDAVSLDDDAKLPISDGIAGLDRAFQIFVVLQCGETLGVAEALMEMTVEHARNRVQFGRPIGSFQAIRHKCADMRVALDGMRTLTRYAALAVQDRFEDAREAVHSAKSHVGAAAAALAGEALQIHGGVGFTWEYDVHLFLRRAKSNQVLWGDPPWHNECIAEGLLSTGSGSSSGSARDGGGDMGRIG